MITERMFQASVIQLCKLLGIWHYHTFDSRRSVAGFPDLLILGKRGALWRELKREDGRVTAAQSEVGLRMDRIGWDWAVWRPADLASGRVQRELEAIR